MGSPFAHMLALLDLQADGIRDLIELDLAVVRGDRDVAQRGAWLSSISTTPSISADGRHLLGLSGLEELFDSRKALGDIVARDAAGVEGTHGQLSTRLADGLSGDDADRLAEVDGLCRWRG